jgi:hypothetical protein
MRVSTSDHFVRWANGTGLIALGGLAWAVFGPGGPLWTALLAAGLVSAALAAGASARSRPRPVPAEVGASAMNRVESPMRRGRAASRQGRT